MMRMKIWFPDFFTEAHRKPGEGEVLASYLEKYGIICSRELTSDCEYIFCGTIWLAAKVEEARKAFPAIPVIHYNWDLYPFQVYERSDYQRANPDIWVPYLKMLQNCHEIWVPSECTIKRTFEFTGRKALVVMTSVRPWSFTSADRGSYAVDVMRKYPDPNRDAAAEACKAVGIKLVESRNELAWPEFCSTIGNARFLISAQFEASTGGLTLLEGLWHGVPSLISNSPRHGGIDYFKDAPEGAATFFQWDSPPCLQKAVLEMYHDTPRVSISEAREFIMKHYSEEAMAKRMATRLWELRDGAEPIR